MTDLRIRRATVAVLDELIALGRAYHEFEGIELVARTHRESLQPLIEGDDHGGVWVAEEAGGLIAYVALCFGYSIEFGGRDAFVDEAFVVTEARGRGVGRRLLEHALDEAELLGVRAIHLEVAGTNVRARSLYESLGFELRSEFHLMSRKHSAGPSG